MLEIHGIKCSKCKTVIYSRAHHDFHWCPCESIYIDGGFEYMRVGYKDVSPIQVKFSLETTKKELYDDWSYHKNIFGYIKEEDQTIEITEIKLEEQER